MVQPSGVELQLRREAEASTRLLFDKDLAEFNTTIKNTLLLSQRGALRLEFFDLGGVIRLSGKNRLAKQYHNTFFFVKMQPKRFLPPPT